MHLGRLMAGLSKSLTTQLLEILQHRLQVGHANIDELLVAIFDFLSGLLRAGRLLSGTCRSRYYFNKALRNS
jgi:hypothetical protein